MDGVIKSLKGWESADVKEIFKLKKEF